MSTTFKPFQEEHHIFRQQVRGFAENELAPKVDQWEEEELFPNSVFERAGELGILGAHYPEDVKLALEATVSDAKCRLYSRQYATKWDTPRSFLTTCPGPVFPLEILAANRKTFSNASSDSTSGESAGRSFARRKTRSSHVGEDLTTDR